MTEQSFFEVEALEHTMVNALCRVGGPPAETLIRKLPSDTADALNDILVQLYEKLPDETLSIDRETIPAGLTGYGMRWRTITDQGTGQPVKMRFFRVKEAGATIAINVVGLAIAIAIAMLSPGGITNALNIGKAVYDNVVTLERDHDRAAMRCYEAIVLFRAKAAVAGTRLQPTVGDIAPLAGLSDQEALKAVRTLAGHKIVLVADWGGAQGDLDHPGNRWKIEV
jgi:hypothetical protein